MTKITLLLGVFFCSFSVVMGAFGAHALKDNLSEYSMTVYNKAVLYQMFHALGIILISILNQIFGTNELNLCSWLFIVGIILFSGSLFVLSITGIKWFGAITPIGGILFIVGWMVLFFKILKLQVL